MDNEPTWADELPPEQTTELRRITDQITNELDGFCEPEVVKLAVEATLWSLAQRFETHSQVAIPGIGTITQNEVT